MNPKCEMKPVEVLRKLGICRATLYTWDLNGKLKPTRNPKNNHRVYKSEEVEKLVKKVDRVDQ